MACTLIEGISLDCRQGAGGIKKLYLTEFANVSSITSSSGQVSAITMSSLLLLIKFVQWNQTVKLMMTFLF